MIIKHAQLIQPPVMQLVCRVWETQMPYQQHYMAHMDFKAAESKWEQSYKQYPIREWDKDKFIFLAEDSYGKITSHEAAVAFTKKLSQGIYIDPAKVEIANICIQTGQGCGMTCLSEETCNASKYAVLKQEKKSPELGVDIEMDDTMYDKFLLMATERQETSALSFLSGAECMLDFIKKNYKLTGKTK